LSVFLDPADKKENRVLVSVSSSPHGASPWQAVSLDQLRKPLDWTYSRLLYQLSFPGEDDGSEMARQFGRSLFDVFFPGKVGERYRSVRDECRDRDAPLRLAIDAGPGLVEIPWELLHDGVDFVLTQDCSVIRIERLLRPDVAYFGPLTKMGIVAVTVDPDFDLGAHVEAIRNVLFSRGVPSIECSLDPDRRALQQFLEKPEMDGLYYLGNGREGAIQVRASGAGGSWLDAGDLAKWLPRPQQAGGRAIKVVYLNSCSTSTVLRDGGAFSGVAQRLLYSGRIGTVVGMQAQIADVPGLAIASAFLERLAQTGDPEGALAGARTAVSNQWARFTPVLYTHVNGPQEFERNRLKALLQATDETRFSLCLATIVKGVRKRDLQKANIRIDPPELFRYPNECHPRTAVRAAASVIELLTKIVPATQIEYADAGAETDGKATHQFYFGGHQVQERLGPAGAKLQFAWNDSEWWVTDTEFNHKYSVPNVSRLTPEEFEAITDFGFIEKLIDNGKRVLFGIAGFGDVSTRGAARFLADNWKDILERYPTGNFALVLMRRPRAPYHEMIEVDRMTGRKFQT
jgi:hypothetical protein